MAGATADTVMVVVTVGVVTAAMMEVASSAVAMVVAMAGVEVGPYLVDAVGATEAAGTAGTGVAAAAAMAAARVAVATAAATAATVAPMAGAESRP